jgi:Ca-activated chloride channel family protein
LGYSLLTPYTTFIAVDEVFSNAANQAENVHSQASADELQ